MISIYKYNGVSVHVLKFVPTRNGSNKITKKALLHIALACNDSQYWVQDYFVPYFGKKN